MTSTEPTTPRHTRQRAAVAAIMESLDEFRTAQEVHASLQQSGSSVGLATVYRTLAHMAEDGRIDCLRAPDGQAAYRRCSTDRHHHHLVCRECGRAVEIDPPGLDEWATRIAAENGFTEVDHEFELFGRCAACHDAR